MADESGVCHKRSVATGLIFALKNDVKHYMLNIEDASVAARGPDDNISRHFLPLSEENSSLTTGYR